MGDAQKAELTYSFDRHTDEYRLGFEKFAEQMQAKCPVAWNETYGGHWFVAGNQELFEIARSADKVSNDLDPIGKRKGYQGISIPAIPLSGIEPSFLTLDPPAQRHYRQALNPYLSPAAVARWKPIVEEITRAALDEKIESGSIDFVDDLANVVPAVLTLAMMGLPLEDWVIYCEPAHAVVYTQPTSPEMVKVVDQMMETQRRLLLAVDEGKRNPKPGLINALINSTIDGRTPTDEEIVAQLQLLIGGGFDTTTALTAHSLEWLGENPDQRERLRAEFDSLIDSATEEFLRFYTPAPGDGRTLTQDCVMAGVEFKEGERLWLSWAMANRDPKVFPNPNEIVLDRPANRHSSFGLGIHRCIGSNVARQTFKTMVRAVLQRMPDYVCDPAGAVHYDTVGVINGMKHLPATFAPGTRLGPGLDETIAILQERVEREGLAEPIVRGEPAEV